MTLHSFFFFYWAYFRKVVYQSGKCCEHDVIIMVPYASRLLTNHPCFPHLVDFKSMIKNLILLMLTLALYQYTSMFYTGKKKKGEIFVPNPLKKLLKALKWLCQMTVFTTQVVVSKPDMLKIQTLWKSRICSQNTLSSCTIYRNRLHPLTKELWRF